MQVKSAATRQLEPDVHSRKQLLTPISSDFRADGESMAARESGNSGMFVTYPEHSQDPENAQLTCPLSILNPKWSHRASQAPSDWEGYSEFGLHTDELLFGKELELNWNDFAIDYSTSATVDPVNLMGYTDR